MLASEKIQKRLRRSAKTRWNIKRQQQKTLEQVYRICIHKTAKNFYAQLLTADGAKVLTSVSSLESKIKSEINYGGNKEAAKKLAVIFAQRVKDINPSKIAFDRSGFKYHGRVKVFAETLRESGVKI